MTASGGSGGAPGGPLWRAASPGPAPASGEAHAWYVDLTAPPIGMESALALLSPAETARAERFRIPPMRRRYVLARAALRLAVGRALDRPATEVLLYEREDGKPCVASDPPLWFNLAHSADLLLIVLSGSGEVGVDVEQLRALPTRDALARRVLARPEREFMASVPESERARIFLRGWTRKEAVLKATGHGLRIAPSSIEVTLDDPVRCEWRYVGTGDPPSDAPELLRGLVPVAGCEAAVALRRAERVTCRWWSG